MPPEKKGQQGLTVIPDPERFKPTIIIEVLRTSGVLGMSLGEVIEFIDRLDDPAKKTAGFYALAALGFSVHDANSRPIIEPPVRLQTFKTKLSNNEQPLPEPAIRPAILDEPPASEVADPKALSFMADLLGREIDKSASQTEIERFLEGVLTDHEKLLLWGQRDRHKYEALLIVRGLSYKEIARLMKTSHDSVRQRRMHTIKRIHKHPDMTKKKLRQRFADFLSELDSSS